MSTVFVLVVRWAEKRFLSNSWQVHLCFIENDLGGVVQTARAGREVGGWGGKEGPLECGNSRRCEMEQAGVQGTRHHWHLALMCPTSVHYK